MLVLARCVGEVIRIGDEIEVVVCEIKGDRVVLGVTAPKEIPVHRQEIYDLKHGIDPQPKPSTAAILGHRKD